MLEISLLPRCLLLPQISKASLLSRLLCLMYHQNYRCLMVMRF